MPAPLLLSDAQTRAPDETATTLPVHISGGQAQLIRFGQSAEEEDGSLGAYDPTVEVTYDWPSLPTDALPDLNYSSLYVKNGRLRYFRDVTGSGDTIAPVASYQNRVRAAATSFKENTSSYPRDAALLDRDVAIGDVVYIRGSYLAVTYDLWTTVTGFKAEQSAAVVAAATADAGNATTDAGSDSVVLSAGDENCVVLVVDSSSYDGLADGAVDEYYYLEVTQGSIDGDYTSARLRVTTASGLDEDDEVTPAAAGVPFDIGTRGLTGYFDAVAGTSCSNLASEEDVAPDDLIVGQKFTIHVLQAFTASAATSGGTYTGTTDTTYIIRVTTGGVWADSPKITVTTTTGVDMSGPTTVTAAASAVAVGTKGVTVVFSNNGLCKGDIYYITVTAPADAEIQTLVLADNLPDELFDNATDLDLDLYIPVDGVTIPADRVSDPPTTNYDLDRDTGITVNSGILMYESTWTDSGVEQPLPLIVGDLYLHTRYWLQDDVGELVEVTGTTTLANAAAAALAALGTVHPDNPLAYGLYVAMAHAGDRSVFYTAVSDPDDSTAWEDALEVVAGRDEVFTLVPLSRDSDILDLFVAHVEDEDLPLYGLDRRVVLCKDVPDVQAIVSSDTSSDDDTVLATLADDPDTSGTQYTYMTITSGNAELITLGVRAGDVVRYVYSTDGFGNDSYSEFVVDEVVSNAILKLATGHTAAVAVAQRVEIWRTLLAADIVTVLEGYADDYDSTKVVCVYPNTIEDADLGVTVGGEFLAAALGAMRSGISPHQSLRNIGLNIFGDNPKVTGTLRLQRARTLPDSGITVVANYGGTNYVLVRGVTTAQSDDFAEQEEVIQANAKSILRHLRTTLAPVIQGGNLDDDTLNDFRSQLLSMLESMESTTNVAGLGPQIKNAYLSQFGRHPTQRGRLVAHIQGVTGDSMNTLDLAVTLTNE